MAPDADGCSGDIKHADQPLGPRMMLLPSHYDYLGVLLVGGAVGAAELVSRYRDHPYRALWTTPSGFYMAVGDLKNEISEP